MLNGPIRLDMNEIPTLPPCHVVDAARRGLSQLNRYADPRDLARLRALLGTYAGAAPDRIIVGPGSDLLLREIVLAFGRDRTVITPSPTFFPTLETVRYVAPRWIGLRLSPPAFTLEPEVLLDGLDGPCLVIIDHPNNPTGQLLLDRETVQRVANTPGTLLVVDEAYYEFGRVSAAGQDEGSGSFVDLVEDCPSLTVTRTMDKTFGLAGARVGYAVVGDAVREAFTGFYAFLPQPSLYAATAALEDASYAEETADRLIVERERLREALRETGARVAPSHANFLLIRTRMPDVAPRLAEMGVLVSDVSNQLPPGTIRVSVGTPEENDAFLAAFRQIREIDESLDRRR